MIQLRSIPVVAVSLLGLAACADAPTAAAPSLARAVAPSAEGRYLVHVNGNAAKFRSSVEALGGRVSFLHAEAGVAIVTGLSGEGATKLASNATVGAIAADERFTLALPQEVAAADAVGVESDASSVANPATAARYSWQWSMPAIGADKAWAAGKLGSSDVTVAILDTGLDYTSLDIAGLVDLGRSASFVASDAAITAAIGGGRHAIDDYNGHGTNVATQVSSKAVVHAGVTSKTTLIGVKVLGADGSGEDSGVLQGVLWAADHGADVINMSLGGAFLKAGGGGGASIINRVFQYASKKGAVVVVAAGNSSADLDHNTIPSEETGEPEHYPSLFSTFCDTPGVICVSAVGKETAGGSPDMPAYYTNFGRSAITVAGPGGAVGTAVSVWPWGPHIASFVWSMCARNVLANTAADPANPANRPCRLNNRVSGMIGTSQAAPHVAGLAALLVAEMGKGKPSQIKARIQQSADDLGQAGTDPYFGKGRVNVARALGL
jgi:subtilisin family serine protease